MANIILQGLLIGLLISASMGPIGVMCIQRTLNGGWVHGFATGLGATFSDIVYAIIAAFGLGFVVYFLESNYVIIQIIVSVFILAFGYYTFNRNPTHKLTKQDNKPNPLWKDFVSGFFLNLSNISILVSFIALFARFNFIDPENYSLNVVGILSVGVGAVAWWLFISQLVGSFRSRFNPRGLMIFNRILGSVLMVIGLVGVVAGVYQMIKGESFL